jgi:hypothetical protein
VIELDGNLDVWTTDDISAFDSEEVYQLRGLLKSHNHQRVTVTTEHDAYRHASGSFMDYLIHQLFEIDCGAKYRGERSSLLRYVKVTNQCPKARDPIERADRRCYLNYALAEPTWLSAGH